MASAKQQKIDGLNALYPLPMKWEWKYLNEICKINPRRPQIEREDNKMTSFVPMSSVDEAEGRITDLQKKPFAEIRRGYTYFEENDVLFAKITPCMENGKSAVARQLIDSFGFGSTEFHVLRHSEFVIPEWIHLFVRRERYRTEAKKNFRGAVGQQRVPADFLKKTLIPLPPSTEIQIRIVARIESLLSEIKEARKLLDKMRRDAERVMDAALGEVFLSRQKDWLQTSLGRLLEKITTGTTPPSREDRYYNEDIQWFTPGDLGETKILEKSKRTLSKQAIKERKAKLFKKGTLMFVGIGATLGKVGVAGIECSANQQITSLEFNSRVDVDYAYYWFRANSKNIRKQSGQATLPILNQSGLKNLDFYYPESLTAQKRIVQHLDYIDLHTREAKDIFRKNILLLDKLEQSILERAFRGEL
ncbi:MAG: restriction endonuclease subunit S [Candidatus Thorarchaeota archaeon]